jgi:hypothetical protein
MGPHFALAGSFNEWSNPNDLDLLKKEATAFKALATRRRVEKKEACAFGLRMRRLG